MKDHEIAKLVNELTDVAIKYRDTQQLREQIHRLIVPALKSPVDCDARIIKDRIYL